MALVRLVAALLIALFCAWGQENDWLIVPGKRVGPVTFATTRTDLVKFFGLKSVADAEILSSDFAAQSGTTIYLDRPDMSLAIYWADEAVGPHIRWIRFCPNLVLPAKCKWHTAEGIAVGTSLKELEHLNGHGFRLNGFDWGFGGLITSWAGGRLEKLASSCGSLTLRVDPPPGPATEQREQLLDAVEINDEFVSSHTAMQALNPLVDYMNVSFLGCH